MPDTATGDPFATSRDFVVGDPGRAALEVGWGSPDLQPGPPDIEVTARTLHGVELRAASLRGLSHRAHGGPRQDAYAIWRPSPVEWPFRWVVSVCDGVGGLARSELAAAVAGDALVQRRSSGFPWWFAFAEARRRVLAADDLVRGELDSVMATTAIAADVTWADGRWTGSVAWTGDASAWHLGEDARWTELAQAAAEEGEVHSTATEALPRHGERHESLLDLAGGALFLMTDGVANPLRWSERTQERLAQWWADAPDPLTFAAQVGFGAKTHQDDRTVVGLWRPPEAEGRR